MPLTRGRRKAIRVALHQLVVVSDEIRTAMDGYSPTVVLRDERLHRDLQVAPFRLRLIAWMRAMALSELRAIDSRMSIISWRSSVTALSPFSIRFRVFRCFFAGSPSAVLRRDKLVRRPSPSALNGSRISGILGGAMSQENVELRYRAADAFNRHELDALLALCDPKMVFISHHLGLESGGRTLHGHDGVRTW
jgi:hypothetical protein